MSNTTPETIELSAADGARISAYHVRPKGRVRGGVVVVQEIFGVNAHIRRVAEGFAERGYEVIAPALFDRVERGVELAYDEDGIARGRALAQELGLEHPLRDLQASIDQVGTAGRVAVVGYCWGGTLAYLAAARLAGLAGAVAYYGGQVARFASERPRVPVLLHFGEQDKSIPKSDVTLLQLQLPELEYLLYPAGHGFNCEARASYDAASADLALDRTLGFFERNVD